jgi:arginyl-tRNA synthetase
VAASPRAPRERLQRGEGFLNLEVADAEWLAVFEQLRAQPATAPVATGGPRQVVVEYSSPNTNKPLHLGHLRNNFLGYSVAEILKATGARVTKANLVNDRGIHICKSMIAYQHFGHGETPATAGLKGDHLAGKYYVLFERHYREEIRQLEAEGVSNEVAKKRAPLIAEAQQMLQAWEAGDEAVVSLWRRMNGWVYEGFDETYRTIGVDFDKFYYESETYLLGKERVEEGLQKGVFFRKDDGSVWVDLQAEGLDEKLLLRADGTSVYITQDLGTAELKYQTLATTPASTSSPTSRTTTCRCCKPPCASWASPTPRPSTTSATAWWTCPRAR